MLPLKLVRSLVLGASLVQSQNNDESESSATKTKTPLLVFLPTKELVSDTYRLATIAREMGMDLLNSDRIDTMDAFSRALAGMGWTLFKTKKNPSPDSAPAAKSVFFFRKVDSGRVRALRDNGGCRIRELRLPPLDFRNAPLRILQYIILMTDDVFYLA
ncbi:hypothetical protein EZV62_014830 [Acer yangbiense]|uniref:Uncharacterized protein n=1 Tax=Acer yangbiense TaxID=1000413 RepID=A0A5C7HT33_9ROSI|nr:hypothetical protein EZV62_014830 [Acer yangbiense]